MSIQHRNIKRTLGRLQPCQIIFQTGEALHQLYLLLLPGGERLLDVEQLRPDRLGLLYSEAPAMLDELGVDTAIRNVNVSVSVSISHLWRVSTPLCL